jgi:hypothetical protein
VPSIEPEIGVLLPVRLETRFVEPRLPRAPTWRLRVRIVPDAVAITTHDETPTGVELVAVTRFWSEVGDAELESPTGQRALRGLVAAVGFERAAWLARSFPPVTGPDGEVTVDRPATTRDALRASTLHGLPPTIELWWARRGRTAERAGVLSVLADEIDLDFADPDGPRQAWWASFAEAVRVGLAAELDLGDDPSDIDVLYAVGIGGGDPGPLLAAHADTGRLGVIATGTATTSIDGGPAASLGEDVAELPAVIAPAGAVQPGRDEIGAAVRATLPPLVGGAATHRPLNQALVRALWPALWGRGLASVLGYTETADPLGLWAGDNLVPEGPLPVLRVGKQPYGLLPATSLARWVGASGDPAVEGDLVPLVAELVRRWAARAELAARAGDRSLATVLRTPTATRYEWRWLVPDQLVNAVAFRFGSAVDGTQQRDWVDRRAAAAPAIGDRPAPNSRLLSVGWGHPVSLPLTGDTFEAPDAATMDSLLDAPATSLLGELTRHSLAASAAIVARTAADRPRAIVEPLSADAEESAELDGWALRFAPSDLGSSPASDVHRNVLSGLDALAELPRSDVERGLVALLDTATHRIDPWAIGIAWRRLRSLADAPRSLGVYGWVDAPRPRASSAMPEYVLAPSLDQAMVAAVLRDRDVSDPDNDRWQLRLDSDRVRGALRLSDEVRAGGHPAEVLGRLVEQVVQRPDVVEALRTAFPLLPSLSAPGLQVRRVCDGIAVLAACAASPDRLTSLGVTAGQLASLSTLDLDVDALADLQLAESVRGLVRGRPVEVAAATAAASGAGIPSSLDVVRTPRLGRDVTTVAVVVLPTTGLVMDDRPSGLADGAVAAYLDARAGDPAGPDWTWRSADGTVAITLADAGLRPSDTAGLGADNLTQAVCDATGTTGLAGAVPGHDRVRALAAALSGVPGLPEDVSDVQADPAAAELELRSRLVAVRSAGGQAVARWRAAVTDDELRAALVDAARWGISPLATDDAATRVERAAAVLDARLASAADESAAAALAAGPLGEQIAQLVAPEAAYPVLGRVGASACAALQPDPLGPRIDPDWLETVAPVRRALARLEAVQLDERLRADGAPLAAWTSRPGDIWQTTAQLNAQDVPVPTRLVAAFGPAGVLPAPPTEILALGVVDRFTETVPDVEHDAAVTFRHDLPRARAPQAVLLAVPPSLDAPLEADVLVDIVAEARLLARARLADPAGLGPDAGVLHLAAMSAVGRAGVRVEGS